MDAWRIPNRELIKIIAAALLVHALCKRLSIFLMRSLDLISQSRDRLFRLYLLVAWVMCDFALETLDFRSVLVLYAVKSSSFSSAPDAVELE